MSLIIKDMKMLPYEDIFGDGRDSVYLCMISVNENQTACLYCNDLEKYFYPVEEIPTNHGRLIDADRLLAVLKSMAGTSQSVPTEAVIGLIDHQPVIVEKERNE